MELCRDLLNRRTAHPQPVTLALFFNILTVGLLQASSQTVIEKWQIFVMPLFSWFRDMQKNAVLTLVGFCVILLATKHSGVSVSCKTEGQPRVNVRGTANSLTLKFSSAKFH